MMKLEQFRKRVSKAHVRADVSSHTDGGSGSAIGELLRDSRLRRGDELIDAAQSLRIRQHYLQALEDGRIWDLPGPTYAVGFIRTYAEYLGLDGEEIVRRYKGEVASISQASELALPSSVAERGVPGVAFLLVSVLLAGSAYGGWYILSTKDSTVAEIVPVLPERLVKLVESVRGGYVPTPSPSVRPHEATSVEAPISRTSIAAGSNQEPAPQILSAVPLSLPLLEFATGGTLDNEVEGQASIVETTIASLQGVNSDGSIFVQAAVIPAVPMLEPAATDAVELAAEPERVGFAADVGTATGGRHIVVHARTDSWVQVHDGISNTMLLTRLMHAGDTYDVPNKPGLKLVTGNAGALEIIVDGELAPSIGPIGAVRRDVALDADKLLDGTATRQ